MCAATANRKQEHLASPKYMHFFRYFSQHVRQFNGIFLRAIGPRLHCLTLWLLQQIILMRTVFNFIVSSFSKCHKSAHLCPPTLDTSDSYRDAVTRETSTSASLSPSLSLFLPVLPLPLCLTCCRCECLHTLFICNPSIWILSICTLSV